MVPVGASVTFRPTGIQGPVVWSNSFASSVVSHIAPGSLTGKDSLDGLLVLLGLENQSWHWFSSLLRENCGIRNIKTGRRFYNRPHFISPAVDLSLKNWILISSHYSAAQFKTLALRSGLALVVQLHGMNHWKLTAKDPCARICPFLQGTLAAGEIRKNPVVLSHPFSCD